MPIIYGTMHTTALLTAMFISLVTPSEAVPPARQPSTASPPRLISDLDALVGFGTRHTLSTRQSSTTRGIDAAADWLERRLQETAGSGGPALIVRQQRFTLPKGNRIPEPTPGRNVLAIIPAASSSFVAGQDDKAFAAALARADAVIVMAHYDSRVTDVMDATSDSPGANDNGSGTVAVVEAVRVIRSEIEARKLVLSRDLIFVLTTAEEQGLLGARELAEAMRSGTVDVLNLDIVGDPTGHPLADGTVPRDDRRIRIFSEAIPRELPAEKLAQLRAAGAENDSMSRQLSRFIAETAALGPTRLQPMQVHRSDRFLRGGDHTPFNEVGHAAVRFTQVFEDYDRQHQLVVPGKGDLARHVDGTYLAGVVDLVSAAAIRLASAPRPPEKVELVIADLTHDTQLRWSGSTSPNAAGYSIVWRETTSNEWTGLRQTGDTREIRLEMNKDNYFFGVRAVDANGNGGLVRPAVPVRK